jgi:hypothetical protein
MRRDGIPILSGLASPEAPAAMVSSSESSAAGPDSFFSPHPLLLNREFQRQLKARFARHYEKVGPGINVSRRATRSTRGDPAARWGPPLRRPYVHFRGSVARSVTPEQQPAQDVRRFRDGIAPELLAGWRAQFLRDGGDEQEFDTMLDQTVPWNPPSPSERRRAMEDYLLRRRRVLAACRGRYHTRAALQRARRPSSPCRRRRPRSRYHAAAARAPDDGGGDPPDPPLTPPDPIPPALALPPALVLHQVADRIQQIIAEARLALSALGPSPSCWRALAKLAALECEIWRTSP